MRLSVIIPTYNSAATIETCLESLRKSFRGEVIIADGGSSDGTTAAAMSYQAKIYSSEPGLAHQCNEGAKEAFGEALFFLNPDAQVTGDWLGAIEKGLESAYVVGGAFDADTSGSSFFYRLLAFGTKFRSHYLNVAFPSQALFVRRKAFEAVGGFSEDSFVAQVDLSRRLKELGVFKLIPFSATLPNSKIEDQDMAAQALSFVRDQWHASQGRPDLVHPFS